MNRIHFALRRSANVARRFLPLAMAIYIAIASSPLVWAAKKKKEEAAAPTKSYVIPYMIVIAIMALGMMTVARPGRRLDKASDGMGKEKQEE
jgi:predicted PurR-regulated permease PerM